MAVRAPAHPIPRIAAAPRHRAGYYQVRPGDVIVRSDLLLIDVRPEQDLLGDTGHIHQVTHAPASPHLQQALSSLPRDTPLVFVCGNGRTSARCAAETVREGGFQEIYHLVGGMVRWLAEERPVARVPTWQRLVARRATR